MAKSRIAEAYVQIIPTTDGFASAISKGISQPMDDAIGGATNKFKALGAVVAGVFAAKIVWDFGAKAVESASNLNESLNAVKVSFGNANAEIVALGENAATRLGLSQSAFNSIAVQFSAFAQTIAGEGGNVAGVIDELSTRGADFASVMNLDVNDALRIFQSGLAGETEPLRKYGIDLSAAAVEQYALARGIWDGNGAMTEAQKVQARYGSLMEQTNKVAGDFANTSDGLANAQRIAGAKMEDASAALGSAFLPIIAQITSTLADTFIPVLKVIGDWMAENPAIVTAVAVALGILAVALGIAAVAQWAMNAALYANPITWIVLAVVAALGVLIAIIVVIVQNWDAIAAWFGAVFGPIIQWFGDLFTWLWVSVIEPIVNFIGAIFTWLWESIFQPVINAIGALFTWLWENILQPIWLGFTLAIGIVAAIFTWLWQSVFEPLVNAMAAIFKWLYENVVKPVFDAIGAVFKWIYDSIIKPVFANIELAFKALGIIFEWLYKNIVKPVFDSVAAAFKWVWESIIKPIIDFITSAVETVGDVIRTVFGAIKGFFEDAFKGVVGVIRGPVNAVIGFINTLITGLNKIQIKIPDWVPEWGGKTIGFNIGKIPMLADGGTLDYSGSVMVGENGPEILNLPRGARVTPLDKAGSGNTIVYNAAPNQSIDSEQALFTAIKRAKVVAGW